jgi:hypothetical protein
VFVTADCFFWERKDEKLGRMRAKKSDFLTSQFQKEGHLIPITLYIHLKLLI